MAGTNSTNSTIARGKVQKKGIVCIKIALNLREIGGSITSRGGRCDGNVTAARIRGEQNKQGKKDQDVCLPENDISYYLPSAIE